MVIKTCPELPPVILRLPTAPNDTFAPVNDTLPVPNRLPVDTKFVLTLALVKKLFPSTSKFATTFKFPVMLAVLDTVKLASVDKPKTFSAPAILA